MREDKWRNEREAYGIIAVWLLMTAAGVAMYFLVPGVML